MPELPAYDQPQPLRPFELPPDLATHLQTEPIDFLISSTDQGAAFVVKLPSADIDNVRGWVPVGLTHELYVPAQAPVIRTVLRIYDRPLTHLALETFTNIADEDQAQDLRRLSDQERVMMLFYDEHLAHRLTKVVSYSQGEQVQQIIQEARRRLALIPTQHLDFEAAKRAVMARRRL